jgi:5-hydroxyisourate hydrolase-like protein (transthyretin family)
MRRAIFFALVVLVVGIINSRLLQAVPQDSVDKDNYGKVIGQIVDAETGENVKEKFLITLFKSSELDRYDLRVYTDQNGRFSFDRTPGMYYLSCEPQDVESTYAVEPLPNERLEYYSEVKIEKGKILKVIKKAHKAGTIKVEFVDPNGLRMNLFNLFPKGSISDALEYYKPVESGHYDVFSVNASEDLNTGVCWKKGLCPGRYGLEIEFKEMGIGSKYIKNIEVEGEKVAEVEVMIDLNSTTGIRGKVVDQNNLPAKNITVRLYRLEVKNRDEEISASAIIDSNGDYKILGLEEGFYDIHFHYQDTNDVFNFFNTKSQKIFIKKDQMVTLNKKINL